MHERGAESGRLHESQAAAAPTPRLRRPVLSANLRASLAVTLTVFGTGCFAERSFEMTPADVHQVSPDYAASSGSTREWLTATHKKLAHLLPESSTTPMLTEDLVDDQGQPVDVFAHFNMKREDLQKVVRNFRGIRCTAQAAARDYFIEEPAPQWDGFEDIFIPVSDKLSLGGRLGYARRDGKIADADCIVLMPGLFGDNGVLRTRDLAIFLRDAGYHVLGLEIRGHGQTEARYPNAYVTFGVFESDELMAVSDWLEDQPHINRTGLVGFCWSSNVALLAAWYDHHAPDSECIHPAIRPELTHASDRRRFRAGIIAFSPVLGWETLMDELDTPRSTIRTPIFAAIQQTIKDRMIRKNHPEKTGNLRNLIEYEYRHTGVPLPNGSPDGYPFIRLIPYHDEPWCDKLENARMPVLIVHGSDDPLAPSQDVATLISLTDNPGVAAIILSSGGHVGFAHYCGVYYYNLVANFFSPTSGAAAHVKPAD